MMKRCQNKFRDKFENNNKNYTIYIGVLVGSLAVFYFYRFYLATIVFSYLLGCLGCYCCINSSVFIKYIEQLNYHASDGARKQAEKESSVKTSCDTCGSATCGRHPERADDRPAEPWLGLKVHKQLDQAIQDLYNGILEHFVSSWYSKVTLQPFFVDELRHQLRYASACLLRRLYKCDIPHIIMARLLPCALQHCRAPRPHAAVGSRRTELNYLRALTEAVMPYLLKDAELNNAVFRVLVREILSGWLLLSLADTLASPHTLNTLLLLATDEHPMSPLPDTPNYHVEFLETFVRQSERAYTERCKLWKLHLEVVMSDQDLLYALMQHLKSDSGLNSLHLYNDIKSFQSKILNPELQAGERAALREAAGAMWRRHVARDVALAALAGELLELAEGKPGSVKRLQTSRALYQMARQSHDFLEKVVLPKFLHSEEFYKLMIGSRLPTGYQKQDKRPQPVKPLQKARYKPTVEGLVLDKLCADTESLDNIDLLNYLQSLASDDDLREHDLSTFKVVLTNVEVKPQVPPRRGTVRVFTVTVHRASGAGGAGGAGGASGAGGAGRAGGAGGASGAGGAGGAGGAAALWSLQRSERDFHLLRTKLLEFHGDAVLHQLVLPNRRDNSPLETLRYKYEDFLQQLVRRPLLQTSQLLSLFLTVEGEFSLAAASSLSATTDLANIYQSVTRRLRKEKGQHLETFLTNLLISTDIERYQALKVGAQVEEAVEVNEEAPPEVTSQRQRHARDLRNALFPDSGDITPAAVVTGNTQQVVTGFTGCLMFFLVCVVEAPRVVWRVVGGVCGVCGVWLNACVLRAVSRALRRVACARRIARVVALAQELILTPRTESPAVEATRARALTQLLRRTRAVPPLAPVVQALFTVLQNPMNNKHLVYSLLDLCILELFPELNSPEAKPQTNNLHTS